jgi:hypothetical protein
MLLLISSSACPGPYPCPEQLPVQSHSQCLQFSHGWFAMYIVSMVSHKVFGQVTPILVFLGLCAGCVSALTFCNSCPQPRTLGGVRTGKGKCLGLFYLGQGAPSSSLRTPWSLQSLGPGWRHILLPLCTLCSAPFA